jgi:hypothetical protein
VCGACTYAGNAGTEGACEVCGTPAAAPRRAGAEAAIVVDDDDRPVGRILADDVIDALLPERGRLHFPRLLQ